MQKQNEEYSEKNEVVLDRKELKKADAFVKKSGALMHWVQNHLKEVTLGVGVLLVCALGFLFFKNYQDSRNLKQAADFYSVQKSLQEKLAKIPPQDSAWEEKAGSDFVVLKNLVSSVNSDFLKFEAYLYLAKTYESRGALDKAIETLNAGANRISTQDLKGSLEFREAQILEEQGKQDQAISLLESISKSTGLPFRAEVLLALARNQEIKPDLKKAKETYDLILKDFPASPYSKTADAKKAKLNL